MERSSEQEVFIVDTFDPLNKVANQDCVMTFQINGHDFCIRRTILDWGRPVLHGRPVDEDEEFLNFKIYNTLDEAKAFVRRLKQAEAMKD